MSIDDYLKQNIDVDAIRRATEFMESSEYNNIQKIVESENYKMAQEAFKMRDSLIHKDTLVQIEKMQEAIQASGVYDFVEDHQEELERAKESMRKMLGSIGIKDD